PYSVTKHGAVAFAEWLAVTYGDRGIHVACLCPMGVRTPMVDPGDGSQAVTSVLASGTLLEPEAVAEAVVRGLADGRFLILPHPEVGDFWRKKATDVDAWIRGMHRLKARLDKK